MKLTKHFPLDEFTRSATAKANGVDNTLDMTKTDDRNVIENLQHLCQTVLEPRREPKSSDLHDQEIVETQILRYAFAVPSLCLCYLAEK